MPLDCKHELFRLLQLSTGVDLFKKINSLIIIIIINLFIQCRNITQNNLDVESWGGCANSTEKKINFEKLKRKQSKGKHGKIIKVKSY